MKRILAGLFFAFTLGSCENGVSDQQATEKDSIARVGLEALFNSVKQLPGASLRNDTLFLGDTAISVQLEQVQEKQIDGKWVYGTDITTSFKTGAAMPFGVGSIGIGVSRKEAIDVCIMEWFAVFGVPFTNMLKDEGGIKLDGLKIFAAPVGIRGNAPEGELLKGDDESAKEIILAIRAQIEKESNEVVAVDIKLIIGADGVSGGECRINNNISLSAEALENLKKLSWPATKEEFMFKQYFIIKKLQ